MGLAIWVYFGLLGLKIPPWLGLEEEKVCSILGVLVMGLVIQEGLGCFLRFQVLEELWECLAIV